MPLILKNMVNPGRVGGGALIILFGIMFGSDGCRHTLVYEFDPKGSFWCIYETQDCLGIFLPNEYSFKGNLSKMTQNCQPEYNPQMVLF